MAIPMLADPNDLWERYIAETDAEWRSPQGAIAFTVDALSRAAANPAPATVGASPSPDPAKVREAAQRIIDDWTGAVLARGHASSWHYGELIDALALLPQSGNGAGWDAAIEAAAKVADAVEQRCYDISDRSQSIGHRDAARMIAKHILALTPATPSPAADRDVMGSADDIRAQGWAVAVHNDYRLNGETATFWLFTGVTDQNAGLCLKGEGATDTIALDQVRAAIRNRATAEKQGGDL